MRKGDRQNGMGWGKKMDKKKKQTKREGEKQTDTAKEIDTETGED